MASDQAYESETSERSLRAIVPLCTETSHVHADPRAPYACALLRERDRYRHEMDVGRRHIAELEAERDQARADAVQLMWMLDTGGGRLRARVSSYAFAGTVFDPRDPEGAAAKQEGE